MISLYLDSTGQYEGTLSLLGPDIDTFTSNLPTTIPPFSRCLSSAVTTLQTVADAGSPTQPAAEPRSRLRARHSMPATPTLSSQLRERCRTLREMQLIELPASRSEMTQAVARVLAAQAQVLEETVVLLERTKHGALARATKAKADHLATVARGLDGKLK